MSVADELQKLMALRDAGALTSEEFEEQKRRLLKGHGGEAPLPSETAAPEPEKKSMGMLGKILIGLLIAFGLFMALGAYESSKPENKERYDKQSAIDLCWEEHERKSFDSSTKRFIASTCEKMEADYRRKYGRNP